MSPSPGGQKRQPVSKLFIFLALSFVLQCFLWRGKSKLQAIGNLGGGSQQVRLSGQYQILDSRGHQTLNDGPTLNGTAFNSGESEGTETSGSLLDFDYWQWYESCSKEKKPFVFAVLVFWAAFLFATIGITASDFFCPNLATVADRLGMGESTAGVTFLAFGNGSPDVFSTFSALRSNTFSLAIGELLGASAFIVSVVVGSMALIQPFQVPRWAFIRDVGFFTLSVIILVACLMDGALTIFESGGLVILYAVYVSLVVGGNWYIARKERRLDYHRSKTAAAENDRIDAPEAGSTSQLLRQPSLYLDIPDGSKVDTSPSSKPSFSRKTSQVSINSNMSSTVSVPPTPSAFLSSTSKNINTALHTSPQLLTRRISDIPRPTFSLLGAIEFRDAINILKKEGASAGIGGDVEGGVSRHWEESIGASDYFGPTTPFPSGHYHSFAHGHGNQRSRYASPSSRHVSGKAHSIANIHGNEVQDASVSIDRDTRQALGPASKVTANNDPDIGNTIREAPNATESSESERMNSYSRGHHPVPSINLIGTNNDVRSPSFDGGNTGYPLLSLNEGTSEREHLRKRDEVWKIVRATCHILFPALQGFRHKSISGKLLGIFASPAILALTITLPVVDDEAEGCTVNKGGIVLTDETMSDDADLENGDQQRELDSETEEHRHAAGHAGAELHHLVLDGGLPSPGEHTHHQHHHVHANEEHEDPSQRSNKGEASYASSTDTSGDIILLFNKYLTAAQCVLGTAFCSFVFFSDSTYGNLAISIATALGCVLGVVTIARATDGQDPYWRLIRCFAGFLAAMTWIAAIADAVVDILQAFGQILGLSNAIIGLTIFAIGNSCADLIANITVASFAPSMSYAACFGGPMLNILLGIGGAGTYVILVTGHSYVVHFSSTLWVSAIGLIVLLLATMAFIPYNGYWITRRWAIFLLSYYFCITVLNIIVETRRVGS